MHTLSFEMLSAIALQPDFVVEEVGEVLDRTAKLPS